MFGSFRMREPATPARSVRAQARRTGAFSLLRAPGGTRELWVMKEDGGRLRQLTNNANLQFYSTLSVCPEGCTMLFIWKIDLEGGNASALTKAGAQPLTNYSSGNPAISHDGKWIAFTNPSDPNQFKLGVTSVDGQEPPRSFNLPFSPPFGQLMIRWAPDGSGLDYISTERRIEYPAPTAKWRGGARCDGITSGLIYDFAWSADGGKLALAREILNTRGTTAVRRQEWRRGTQECVRYGCH